MVHLLQLCNLDLTLDLIAILYSISWPFLFAKHESAKYRWEVMFYFKKVPVCNKGSLLSEFFELKPLFP